MKRFTTMLLMVGLMVGGMGARVHAEDDMDDAPVEKNIARMKTKLSLSDSQVTKIQDAAKKKDEVLKTVREKRRASMATLQQQVDSKANDKTIAATLDQLKAQAKQMQDEREKFNDAVNLVLTPSQRAKMLLSKRDRKGGGAPGAKETADDDR